MNLLLDIKIHIGCYDSLVWIKLYTYDKEFKKYASTRDGIHMFLEKFRPSYVSLPNKYKGTIRELLPPIPEHGVHGRPFFNSPEVQGVIYKNKFILSGKELEVGDKGYRCVGYSPGSYPQPVIVVTVDHVQGEVGLIYPFVYREEINDDFVTLKVGKDMASNNAQFDILHYNINNNPEVFKISDKYKVCYHNAINIMNTAYCLDIGSFGNIDLPTKNGKIPYEYI